MRRDDKCTNIQYSLRYNIQSNQIHGAESLLTC